MINTVMISSMEYTMHITAFRVDQSRVGNIMHNV